MYSTLDKHIAAHINNCDDVKAEGGWVRKVHSYKKFKRLCIFAY